MAWAVTGQTGALGREAATAATAQYACSMPATERPVCLIVNPAAGGGRAGRIAPVAESALRRRELEVRRVDTRDLDHARELAVEAANLGETVVALSGDGLIGALADVLRDIPGAVLGAIPGGRGNDLARVLSIPDDPDRAAAIVADGHGRPVDLGIVHRQGSDDGGHAFVGIASAGFDSEANRIANDAPSWLGGLVYAYGALRALLAWKSARFEIELDPPGERLSFTAYTIGAANSKTYGGGMRAAPGAMLDDGLLEVMVLEDVGKLAFLTKILPKVFRGTHVNEPSVRVFRAREVLVSAERPFTMYADGDPIGDLPVRVRALRGAVTMLVPRTGVEDSPFSADPFLSHEPNAPETARQARPVAGENLPDR
jgi:YegS/Rv2252/BmrU family lipid kinase